MDEEKDPSWYQWRTSDSPQVNTKTGLDQDSGNMKKQLQKISNRGKDRRQELKNLNKYKKPKSFIKAKIASHVSRNTMREKKTFGQEAHDIGDNKFTTDHQGERNKNQFLKKELKRITAAHNELNKRYKTDVNNIRQKANTFKRERDNEIRHKKHLQSEFEKLKVEYGLMQQKLSAELQEEKNKFKTVQEQLQQTSAAFNELKARYQTDVINASQQQANQLQLNLDNEIKHKNFLQTEYNKLHSAYTLNQQKFAAELQEEKDKFKTVQEQLQKTSMSLSQVNMTYQTDVTNIRQEANNVQLNLNNELQQKHLLRTEYDNAEKKNKAIQQELDMIRVSHCQVRQMYDNDVVAVRQKNETLQRELDREVKAHADTVSEGWRVINTLRAEQDALRQKMAEEIQQNAFNMERNYRRELEELKAQLQHQTALNHKLSTEPAKQQNTSISTAAPEPMETKMSVDTSSGWNTTRHFLGLK